MPPPVWRSSVWAGLFCDPYVTNTGLEGGLGICAMAAYARRLEEAAKALFQDEPAVLAEALGLAARIARGGAISATRGDEKQAPEPNRSPDEEDPVAPFRRHYEALRALAPGDYVRGLHVATLIWSSPPTCPLSSTCSSSGTAAGSPLPRAGTPSPL